MRERRENSHGIEEGEGGTVMRERRENSHEREENSHGIEEGERGTVMGEKRETVRSKRRRTRSSGTEREKENIIGGTQKLRKEERGVRH